MKIEQKRFIVSGKRVRWRLEHLRNNLGSTEENEPFTCKQKKNLASSIRIAFRGFVI